MSEPSLQAAFEIKTACDEISRRLLRWHWEQRPGPRSLDALLQHVAQRQAEDPDYYSRLPDLSAKTSWQQLDTTLCMRVLLDPERDAARPLDLLSAARHSGAARRACHAVRSARNEAAHAASPEDAREAARLYADAVDCLAEAYLDTAFTEAELTQYAREAGQYAGQEPEAPPARKPRAASGSKKPASGGKKAAARRPASGKKAAPAPARHAPRDWGVLLVLALVGLAGLVVRAAELRG